MINLFYWSFWAQKINISDHVEFFLNFLNFFPILIVLKISKNSKFMEFRSIRAYFVQNILLII